ncbi:hypothetical protein SJ05684_c18420 [Sinorhizobium sojae CCBAU 05684]|uniref:Uncharacterized protein n=1 Tax=Sinorhizobium sojae CCBAU 05684 TaxID=716928 RepID=A0A249PC88_9HYPH|nr:hypothetical protein SJ05684_c18420 [Sinorhizobium sojae CCBAU 05684]
MKGRWRRETYAIPIAAFVRGEALRSADAPHGPKVNAGYVAMRARGRKTVFPADFMRTG